MSSGLPPLRRLRWQSAVRQEHRSIVGPTGRKTRTGTAATSCLIPGLQQGHVQSYSLVTVVWPGTQIRIIRDARIRTGPNRISRLTRLLFGVLREQSRETGMPSPSDSRTTAGTPPPTSLKATIHRARIGIITFAATSPVMLLNQEQYYLLKALTTVVGPSHSRSATRGAEVVARLAIIPLQGPSTHLPVVNK